ncbi:MAG: hypothetical protein U9N30_01005, partial [Campylobacterota bacterium]|nr:hypothetical protein [Campylobacterota bacterium]
QLSEKFSYVKTFLVAVEGFEKKDLEKLNTIKKELIAHDEIVVNNNLNNKIFQKYKQTYQYYLNELNAQNSSDIDVHKKLTNIYNQMIASPFYFNLNRDDPLSLVKKLQSSTLKLKNGNLVLGEYGYLAVFKIQSKTDEKSRIKIYTKIHQVLDKYDNIDSFSPIFYYVENSKKIQDDASFLIMLSMFVLSILYLVILKNIYLFVNIAATLISAVILGQIVVTYFFPNTSIIALVFSTATTSVSIDYMFHHYLHNYYNKKLGFNKSVFYGFLTTISAFTLISMIDFPLIKQISIFSIVSLSVAYVHFAFIYPHLQIRHVEPYSREKYKSIFSLSASKIMIISSFILLFSYVSIQFDFNIRNLDYQNKPLQASEKFFKKNLNQEHNAAIIYQANTLDEIIAHAQSIKKIDPLGTIPLSSLLSKEMFLQKKSRIESFDFKNLKHNINTDATKIGFKKGYFKNAYSDALLYPNYPTYTLKMINDLGFNVVYHENQYVTSALINLEKLDEVLALRFVKTAQSKVLFSNSLKKVYDELLLYGGLTLLLILAILLLVTRKKFFYALSYIFFPVAMILYYGCFVPLNILHIFMLFVVLAIGIDYGIYMTESSLSHNTTLAIIYSLISTFAGFGVLILSDIHSLFSIGITATIGILGILFLLLFQKRKSLVS